MMDFTEAYSDRCSTVGAAVRVGDVKLLKELLARGGSVNVHDNRGWTPLHEAAKAGQYECAKILLRKASKEDVNAQTWEGETPLFLAARSGHENILKLLLRNSGDPQLCNNEEGSPILQAVAGNHEACITFLLKKGASVDSQLCSGWSLLHEAACQGFPDTLLLLLQAGAKIDSRDDFGIAPVFTAAQYGHLDCLKLLLQYGADPNSRAEDNATPLYLAAQEGHAACVAHLLTHGASVDIPIDTEDCFLPIHAAAYKGHIKSLELLLPASLSALEMSSLPDELTPSPLHLAARGGHKRAVQMLLEAGCDPDCGIRNPSKDIKDYFIQNAQRLEDSMPPCYCAAKAGYRLTAKILLDAGALMCQASSNFCLVTLSDHYPEALSLLIDLGADVSCAHVFDGPIFLFSCDIAYFKCLAHHGMRLSFNCQHPNSVCPKVIDVHPSFIYLSRLVNKMKMMHCYVDRLDLCEHSIIYLQTRNRRVYNSIMRTPRSLLHLSRVTITEHIGTTKAPKIVPTIDFLPTLLKDYLLYKDV